MMGSIIICKKMALGIVFIPIIIMGSTSYALALRLNVNGVFQLQYKNVNSDIEEEKRSEMFIRRLNLIFHVNITKRISITLEPEYGRGEPNLKDAYFRYRGGGYSVKAGNHLVPFGSESLVNDKSLMFVERSLTSRISPGRNVGTSFLWGLFHNRFLMRGGAWTGYFSSEAEKNLIGSRLDNLHIFGDDNKENDGSGVSITALRIEYTPRGLDRSAGYKYNPKAKSQFAFGISGYQTSTYSGKEDALQNVTRILSSGAYAADLFYGNSYLSFGIEYAERKLVWRQITFLNSETEIITSLEKTATAQLYVPFSSTWSLTARYERFFYDCWDKVLKGKYGEEAVAWKTLGVNADFKKHNTRAQLNFISKDEEMPSGAEPVNNDTLLLQTTVYF